MGARAEPASLATRGSWRSTLGLLCLATLLLVAYGAVARHGPALADEYIYLVGARHLAETGSLDARFYDARAILRQGHPHQDVHSPGYVLILGGLMWLVRGEYWTAVALNLAAYLAAGLLVRELARSFGWAERTAWAAGALYLLLPAYLPYAYWAMAEVVLGTLFLASLVVAARWGRQRVGAAGAGLLFGLAFLVRESALFGLPALLALVVRRGRTAPLLAGVAAVVLGVYLPLSRHRAEGGANFWAPTSGTVFGYRAVLALKRGEMLRAAEIATARAGQNLKEITSGQSTLVEKGILIAYTLLAASTLPWLRSHGNREQLLLLGLLAGWLMMVGVLFGFYVIGQWSGFRYLMVLMPAFLPFAVGAQARHAWMTAAGLAVLFLLLNGGVLEVLNDFKASRQRRQANLTAYVERYVPPQASSRMALPSGWLFGFRHYPVEVISSLPEGGDQLRALERAVWFDYLVLPGKAPLAEEIEARLRYRRVNTDDPEPPLRIFKRLR